MKIFVTGANGFVGKHLCPKLIEIGHDVYKAGYNELPDINQTDMIIHLAAVTTTAQTFLPEMYDSNIVYAHRVMQYPCRIVYASSTSAAENTNPYAATKMYLEYLGNKHPNAVGLRFFNIYGNFNSKGIVKKALENTELTVAGGLQIRDFIYIDDVVMAIIDNLDSPKKIIEVGTGTGLTIEKALRIIAEVTNRKLKIDYIRSTPTDMLISIAKPGIPSCLSFEDGIKMMISK